MSVHVVGTDFGPVPPDPLDPDNYAAVIISPSPNINDLNRIVIREAESWSNDEMEAHMKIRWLMVAVILFLPQRVGAGMIPGASPINCLDMANVCAVDDFLGGSGVSASIGTLGWVVSTVVGGSPTSGKIGSDNDEPGIIR